MTGSGEAALFWVTAPLMVLGALGLVFSMRAVYAALSMALTMVLLGIVYIAQGAEFLGLVQIFVYTGAVMMLFLFVVMMIGVDSSESFVDTLKMHRAASLVAGLALAFLLISAIAQATFDPAPPLSQMNAQGNITGLAYLIYGRYLWIFQMTAALLVTAALAAMVLGHRERLLPKPTQREWSERRVRDNRYVAGLPAPGVYARHNAVDTPALLPDGTPSELSMLRVLAARHQLRTPDEYAASDARVNQAADDADTTQVESGQTSPRTLEEGSQR